jgi:hypothetical protein
MAECISDHWDEAYKEGFDAGLHQCLARLESLTEDQVMTDTPIGECHRPHYEGGLCIHTAYRYGYERGVGDKTAWADDPSGYQQGQRDMLVRCITLIEESSPWITGNWAAVDENAAILAALLALMEEKP